MQAVGQIFQVIIVTPLTNFLLLIYHVLVQLHVPYALGFAIIIMTIAIRFLLYPVMASQLKASKKMSQLSPHLTRLKQEHKGDAQKLQAATMALYKEHGVNPAAGCLPMLIQLPVLLGLYNVLQHIITLPSDVVVKTVNGIAYAPYLRLTQPWNTTFFGMPLEKSPADLFGMVGIAVIFIPLITGLLQFFQTKMMFAPSVEIAPKEKKPTEPDFATAFQTQSLFLFPAMLAFLSFRFPLGLSLYWNTFTIFGMIQQYKLQGWGGLEPWITMLTKKKPVEQAPAVGKKIEKPKALPKGKAKPKTKKKHGK